MNYFLGIFPDEKTNYQIRKIMAEIAKVFDSQDIPIRLSNPENLHLTVLFFGGKLSLVKRKLMMRKIGKFPIERFTINLDSIRLGISRNNRELLFLTVDNGSDKMRQMVLDLSMELKHKREQTFIPHMSIGRVSKDLSDQEYRNLTEAIFHVNKELMKNDTEFELSEMRFIKSENGKFQTLRKFEI